MFCPHNGDAALTGLENTARTSSCLLPCCYTSSRHPLAAGPPCMGLVTQDVLAHPSITAHPVIILFMYCL